MKIIENLILRKLTDTFQPSYLKVENESHMHSVPPGSESHFKVTLVAEVLTGKRQVQRHQAVYACLAEELAAGVHALALHTFSPEDWAASGIVPDSPECLGGSKHNH